MTTSTLDEAIQDVRDLLARSRNLEAVERARGALREVRSLDGPALQLGYFYALASARSGAPHVATR